MLAILSPIFVSIGTAFLAMYLSELKKYINLEVLHRGGMCYTQQFSKYGIYSLIFYLITALCIIIILRIKKRRVTSVSSEKYEIFDFKVLREHSLFFEEEYYAFYYVKANEFFCNKVLTCSSKVFEEEIETAYVLYNKKTTSSPSNKNNFLVFSEEEITYEFYLPVGTISHQ